jgi:hypothetical protein
VQDLDDIEPVIINIDGGRSSVFINGPMKGTVVTSACSMAWSRLSSSKPFVMRFHSLKMIESSLSSSNKTSPCKA